MQYMLLIYSNENGDPPEEDVIRRYGAFTQEVQENGKLVTADRPRPPARAPPNPRAHGGTPRSRRKSRRAAGSSRPTGSGPSPTRRPSGSATVRRSSRTARSPRPRS